MDNQNSQINEEFENLKKKINNFKISRIYIISFIFLVVAFLLYVYMPNLNPKFAQALGIYSLLITLLVLLITKSLKHTIVVYALCTLIIFGLNIYSQPLFHSEAYYNILGEVTTYDYDEVQPEIDSDVLPVVDEELAQILGDKVLGEQIGLGSQYMVGEYYLISTAEDLVWVAPLEPRGFFKWLQNTDGSPGYVYVSATDPNDVRLVQSVNGSDIHLKYTNNSFFFSNIRRHTYFSGNMFRGLTDYSFEIDDEGNPYWVITNYTPSIGISGDIVTGVVVVDAQSGETNFYSDQNNAPDWVERIEPKSLVINHINSWGAYKNGFINTMFGQKEMIQTTTGSSYVYIDGQPYFYTGLTSITNDQSTVGFMLVNSRTGESSFYQITGATETAAQQSAEGQVQQFGYRASFPILVNEYNTPSYFMTLKDSDGLVKQYAYVSVENYNIVAVADSVSSAKSAYYDALKNNGKELSNSSEDDEKISGNVERINYIDSTYYIKLIDNDTLFMIAKDNSSYLPFTTKGDKVEISYISDDSDIKTVTSFTNQTLEQ